MPDNGVRKIVILGGGGYVGRRLRARLAGNASPAAPVASAGVASEERPFRILACGRSGAEVALDVRDPDALRGVLRGADVVVNCVAGSAADIVESTRTLAGVLLEAGEQGPRLIHFSSMAAYGAVTGTVDESAPLRSDLNAYGRAKAESEYLLSQVPDRVVLRPGCIYGPGAPLWSVLVGRLLRQRRLGDLGDAGRACSNLVHVDDVAEAVLRVLRLAPASAASPRVFNLAMRDAPDWNGYFLAYAKALGVVPAASLGPTRLALERWLAGPALKALELALPRPWARRLPPRLSPALLALWRQDIRLDSGRAERELGMRWQRLEPALARMAASGDGR